MAFDPFGGAPRFEATGLPAGLSINRTTGLIDGSLDSSASSSSPYSVSITVVDGSHSASDTFQWTVSAPALSFFGPNDQASAVGLPVSLPLKAHMPGGGDVTYTLTGSLPGGLSLSGGAIAGTPTTAGNFLVTINAASGGQTVTRSFTWQITGAGVAFPGNQTSTEGQTVSLQLQGVGGVNLTYGASGLPAGLILNRQTGLISGTIGAKTTGLYLVDVSATSGTNGGSQSFWWTVNPKVRLTAVNDQTSTEGQTVSVPVQASETGATLSYSARGLPTGVRIDSSTGVISGTLASGTALIGGYTVTVIVSDGTYGNRTSFFWTVKPATTPTAPVLEKVPDQTSVAGESVYLPLNGVDASVAYLEEVKNLPDGLYLDPVSGAIEGVIADDAVSSRPYTVEITANDGFNTPVKESFRWSVEPAPLTAEVFPIAATEGTDTGTITIGSFTTPDLNAMPEDFLVDVSWGDGESDIATVQGGYGSFTVLDNHVYSDQGNLPVSVDIWNVNGATKETTAYGTANVASSLLGGFQLGALAGQSTSLTLAYFNVGSSDATGFYATIDWGDGSADTDVNLAPATNGLFAITSDHTFESIGQKTVTITVFDAYGNSSQRTSTVEVANLYAGVEGTLTLATFTGNPTASYSVTINWGDETPDDTTSATLTHVGDQFTLTASHTFAGDSIDQPGGVYNVAVTITDGGSTLDTTLPVEVTRAPSFLVVANIPATAGTVLSNQVVALFTEPDAADGTTEFNASINWGDGTSGSGNVEKIGNGLFEVVAGHTYSIPPTSALSIKVSQAWDLFVPMLLQSAANMITQQQPVRTEPAIRPTPDMFREPSFGKPGPMGGLRPQGGRPPAGVSVDLGIGNGPTARYYLPPGGVQIDYVRAEIVGAAQEFKKTAKGYGLTKEEIDRRLELIPGTVLTSEEQPAAYWNATKELIKEMELKNNPPPLAKLVNIDDRDIYWLMRQIVVTVKLNGKYDSEYAANAEAALAQFEKVNQDSYGNNWKTYNSPYKERAKALESVYLKLVTPPGKYQKSDHKKSDPPFWMERHDILPGSLFEPERTGETLEAYSERRMNEARQKEWQESMEYNNSPQRLAQLEALVNQERQREVHVRVPGGPNPQDGDQPAPQPQPSTDGAMQGGGRRRRTVPFNFVGPLEPGGTFEPERVTRNQVRHEQMVENQQRQLRDAIDSVPETERAATRGRILNRQGIDFQILSTDTLRQIPGANVATDVAIGVGVGSEIDEVVSIGNKRVYVESNFTIQEVNQRLILQLTNAVRAVQPGDSVILNIARRPTPAELTALQTALGNDVFQKITIVWSQSDLFATVTQALE